MNASLWAELSLWFSARASRERAVVLIATLVLLGYGWQMLVQDNVARFIGTEGGRLQQLNQQQQGLQAQYESLAAISEADPNALLRRTIDRLAAQNKRLDLEIEALSGKLVLPADMASVLSRVMAEQTGVRLIAMSNEPPVSLFFRTGGGEDKPLVIYKHGIELTLQGSYLDVLRYLAAIENIGVRFFWERVEYQVEQYPLGEVSIEVFTLSTQEQLLDV